MTHNIERDPIKYFTLTYSIECDPMEYFTLTYNIERSEHPYWRVSGKLALVGAGISGLSVMNMQRPILKRDK